MVPQKLNPAPSHTMVKNRQLPQTSGANVAKKESAGKTQTVTSDVVLPPQVNAQLINAEIVQILIQNNLPDQVQALMDADLAYNQRRLEILREHATQHPDAIETRNSLRSRRYQYLILLGMGCLLLLMMPFVPLGVAAIFGTVVTLIVCGILVNARERELDLQA